MNKYILITKNNKEDMDSESIIIQVTSPSQGVLLTRTMCGTLAGRGLGISVTP